MWLAPTMGAMARVDMPSNAEKRPPQPVKGQGGREMSCVYSGTASSHAGTTHRGDTSAPHRTPIRATREPGMREMLHRPGDRHMIPESTRGPVEHLRRDRQAATLTPRGHTLGRLPQGIRHTSKR